MKTVYLDNAATTPLLPEVKKAMTDVIEGYFGNPSSIHRLGRESRAIIEESRRSVAERFESSIGEIFFTGSATESNNTVLISAALNNKINHIITSPTEHPCVLKTAQYLEENGLVKLTMLQVDQKGYIDLEHLSQILLKENQALVSIMYANNEIGIVQDVKAIGNLCKEHGAFFHCDAVQAAAHFNFKLSEIPVDFLSMSAHKFHGPKGNGILYMSGETIVPPLIRGGAQERNMRAGTENVMGIRGTAVALEESYNNLDSWKTHISDLRNRLIAGLKAIRDDFDFHGDPCEQDLYTVLNVCLPEHPKSEMLVMLLDMEGI